MENIVAVLVLSVLAFMGYKVTKNLVQKLFIKKDKNDNGHQGGCPSCH